MAVFLIISCEEGPTKIGTELLPSNDFVTVSSTDTLSVFSYTMYNSSVPTTSPALGFVGNIHDPYFGTTTAEFVSQIRLGGAWKYGAITVDSVKMVLRLLTVKGSTAVPHFFKLSEISNELSGDSVYYSDTPTPTTGMSVTAQLPVLRADTINNISVSLPVEFGEYIIRDTSQLFYSNLKPDFRAYFKGLYFQMEPSPDPLIVSFSTTSQISAGGSYYNYFVLFMHDNSNINYRYFFILDAVHPNINYNRIIRDYSTADPGKKITHINDVTYRDTLSYLQYLNGLYTKLVFPGLDSLKKAFSKSKFSINKARIIIPVYYDGEQFTVLTVPQSLRLRYTNLEGIKTDVPDYFVDASHNFFDGNLHKVDSAYYFNIPTFIQSYLEDNTNKLLPELEVYVSPTGLSNAILKANANKTPVRFDLTYTKF